MNRDPTSTLIPEGQYGVIFRECESGIAFGTRRYFAHFSISEPGEFMGLPLIRFYNEPRGRILPRSHNLSLDFTTLFERRPPRNLKPEDFLKGCEVLAQVVTVRHRVAGRRRIQLADELHYSRIDALLRVTAGWPPGIPKVK